MSDGKKKAVWSSAVSGLLAFIAWIANAPLELQDGLINNFIGVFPEGWRPVVGMWARALASASMVYAIHQASISSPKT